MKTFVHHDISDLTRLDKNGLRVYRTPAGKHYPSVTNIVSVLKNQVIEDWKKKVGEAEAAKISSRAAKRGTAVHSLVEQYFKTGTASPTMFDKDMFNQFKPILDRIDNIHCLETPLFSDHLQSAGTVDCIAEVDGKLHIIDFKTSARLKKREWIHDYFMQTSAYSVMFEELTRIPVNRMLIAMAVDNEEPQLFFEKRSNWISQFKELRQHYRMVKGY